MTRPPFRILTLCALLAGGVFATPAILADETQIGPRQAVAQKRGRSQALDAAERWAARNPERYGKLVPPGADLSPGGVPIEVTLRDGSSKTTLADSLVQTVVGLGYTELKGRDRDNLARLYTGLYGSFPVEYLSGLPRPEVVVTQPTFRILQAARQIGSRLVLNFEDVRRLVTETFSIPGLPANPIGVCSNEVGWEAGGVDNENSARCLVGDYAAQGLMAKLDWVLKDDLTCVKDQRVRGTCVAHAVAANVETMIQVQGGVPENLAEQDLNFWGEIQTDLSGRYTDGLSPDEVYDALDAQNFKIQYEASWNYNQSPDRIGPPNASNQFSQSCDLANYTGELCTDYAFQGTETNLGFGVFVFGHPARASTGWEILDWTSIPDFQAFGLPDFQIDTAILFLESEYPVHLSFSVPAAFRSPDANGYVQYNAADPAPTGSHSALAVGFVANADLPAGVPADPDGRGYVVVKNSWGIGYADCGFVYVSTEFLRQWAYAYRYLDKTVTFN